MRSTYFIEFAMADTWTLDRFRLNDEALRFICLESGVGRSCQVLIDKLSLSHRYTIWKLGTGLIR